MSMIEMKDVVKKYDNGTTALRGITVNIDAGEFAYIVGPSGAGKSTMIKTMLGMEKADSGIALVLDHTMPNRHILGILAIWLSLMLFMRPCQDKKIWNFSVS